MVGPNWLENANRQISMGNDVPDSARRTLLAAAIGLPLISTDIARAGTAVMPDAFSAAALMADVDVYAAGGNKASGGPGDEQIAAWLTKRMQALGFIVEQQPFTVPWFSTERADLTVDGSLTPVTAQPLVQPTPADGLRAPIRLAEQGINLNGAIALINLPYRRWSTLLDPLARQPIVDAIARGAKAAVVITSGPSHQALLLNTPADRPLFDCPVALLAPDLAAPVIAAASCGSPATLTVTGKGGARPAHNLIARHDRSDGPWIIVSTPRSGWTDCVGERGPGIAIWLALAAWAVAARRRHKLLFVCTSGHEYENLGAHHLLKSKAPPPERSAFWVHLGANIATRDWHELPHRLLPLPSPDPQRYLVTSSAWVARARQIFAGQPGLEMAYPADQGSAGELSEIIKAGYRDVAGVFGAHRLHHAATDTRATVIPAPLVAAAAGFRNLLSGID